MIRQGLHRASGCSTRTGTRFGFGCFGRGLARRGVCSGSRMIRSIPCAPFRVQTFSPLQVVPLKRFYSTEARIEVYKKRFEERIKDKVDETKEQERNLFYDSCVGDSNNFYFSWEVAREEDFAVLKVQSKERTNGVSLFRLFGSNVAIVFLSYKSSFLNAKSYLEKKEQVQYTQYLVVLKEDVQRLINEFKEGNPSDIIVTEGNVNNPEVIELKSRVRKVIEKKLDYVPVVPLIQIFKQTEQLDVKLENSDQFHHFYMDRLQDLLEHSIPPYLIYKKRKFNLDFHHVADFETIHSFISGEDEVSEEKTDIELKLHEDLTNAKKNGQVDDAKIHEIVGRLDAPEREKKQLIRDVRRSQELSDILNEDFEDESSSVTTEATEPTETTEPMEPTELAEESSEDSMSLAFSMAEQQLSFVPSQTFPHYLNSLGLRVPYKVDIPQEEIAERLGALLKLPFFLEFLSLFSLPVYVSEAVVQPSESVVLIVAHPSFNNVETELFNTNLMIVQEKLAQLFKVPQSKFEIKWRTYPEEEKIRERTLVAIVIKDVEHPFEEETSFNWDSYDSFLKENFGHWERTFARGNNWDEEEL